jgi:hypothetical protein
VKMMPYLKMNNVNRVPVLKDISAFWAVSLMSVFLAGCLAMGLGFFLTVEAWVGQKTTRNVVDKMTFWKKKQKPPVVKEDPNEPYDPLKYPPPDKDYVTRECEPIRLKIVQINQKAALKRVDQVPTVIKLKRDYKKCLDVFNTQEHAFIKHYQFNPKEVEKAPVIEGDSTLRLEPIKPEPIKSEPLTPNSPKQAPLKQ